MEVLVPMKSILAAALLAVAVGERSHADTAPAPAATTAPPAVKCLGEPDKAKPIVVAPGRQVFCAIDLGSNNAKLQVLSMEEGKPLSFRDERQCRARTGLGAIVFDSGTQTRKELPPSSVEMLVTVMKEFQQICALDKGVMIGTEATQWSRDATNMDEVKAAVKNATALDIEVLTPDLEGHYGYVAATRNAPLRFSLDPGSNSFQLGWWQKGADAARAVSIPFGYVRAAKAHYPEKGTDSYEAARLQHTRDLKERIDQALAEMNPPSSLALLNKMVSAGELEPALFIIGQDGALHLAIRGQLRDPATSHWIDTPATYDARIAAEMKVLHPTYGEITTSLTSAEVGGFLAMAAQPAEFEALRTDPIRTLYGERVLANAGLVEMLTQELGLTTVVLVPQEMPSGYILAKLAH
jgi:hypothetical protein